MKNQQDKRVRSNDNVTMIKDHNVIEARILNQNVDECNKCKNTMEIRLSKAYEQCKMLENHNYCRKLTRLNEFINYSSMCALAVQRKNQKIQQRSKGMIKIEN